MRNPLRVLVLEDEWPARNYLVQLIELTGLGHVVAGVPSTALASQALSGSPTPVDVAFVDIQLAGEHEPEAAGMSWIEALAQERELGKTVPRVVLTTASREHAMRAFELGVVDYLLKPFTETRVHESLSRVAALARPSTPSWADDEVRIAARKGRGIRFLRRAEAFAFEAEGRLCYVHSAEGRLDVDLSLTSLEAVLGPSYLRVHRNWLVSANSVRSMEREGGDWVLAVGPSDPPLCVHVARDRAGQVRDRLLASAVGLRREP
jgi:two-component system, LytTR family, response regulator LytT